MARIRSIKPEFWTDEKVVSLSALARLLFIGLWNFADDYGRGEYSPFSLKLKILPADDCNAAALLSEIREKNLIAVYLVDGKEYFQIGGFTKHQKIDKRTPSKFPPPTPTSAEPRRFPPTSANGGEGEMEVEGKGTNEQKESIDLESFVRSVEPAEPTEPSFSPKEIENLQVEHDLIDVAAEMPGLERWATKRLIFRTVDRREAIGGALKKKQEKAAGGRKLAELRESTGPPIEVSPQLAASMARNGRRAH